MSVLDIEDPANVEIINIIEEGGGYDIAYDENRIGIMGDRELSFYLLDEPNDPELAGSTENNIFKTGAISINGD